MGLISGVNRVMLDPHEHVIHGRREISGGYETLQADLPCVLSVKTAANEPRFMDYRIKSWAQQKEQVTIWTHADLEADPDLIGLAGSPTRVSGLEQAETRERLGIRLEGSPQEIAGQLCTILLERLQ